VSSGLRVRDFRSRRRRGAAFRGLKSAIRAQLSVARREMAEFWADVWWRIMERLLRLLVRGSGRQRGRWGVFRLRVPVRVAPKEAERIEHLLSMQDALGDWKALSELGDRTRAVDSTFHLDPEEVAALCRRVLELNLPFLDLGGVMPEGGQGERVEVVERMMPAIVHEKATLLFPEVTTVESRWRHGELSYRPADALADLYRLPLHERALPPALLLELLLKGELYVPGRGHRPEVEFVPREVMLPQERLVPQPVVCRLPQADSSEPKRIVYFLVDTSQSMRGPLAVLSAAIVRAVLLANLGRPRVYFTRAFAADVEPAADLPPREARSTAERIALADWVIDQSFSGPETRMMQALSICLRDIRQACQERELSDLHAAEVILISDSRSTILPFLQEEVRKSGIQLHVVALGSFRNPDLEAIAATYSAIPDAQSLQVGRMPAPDAGRPAPDLSRRPATLPGG
jgi:hypothetical protein